jgi:polysaccharide pyruvyl transferase WcaK-like protein
MPYGIRSIDEPATSVDQLLSQLSMVDVVVSCRFHNLLLALMLGKPVFAISYHAKFQPLMASVGLGEFCQDIEHIDVDTLIEKVIVLEENASTTKQHIGREIISFRDALDEQYHRIVSVLYSPGHNHGTMPAGDACI